MGPFHLYSADWLPVNSRDFSKGYTMDENEKVEAIKVIMKAAVDTLLGAALDAIYADPHSWSMRPCDTCRVVSTMTGKPFGCIRKQAEAKKKQE